MNYISLFSSGGVGCYGFKMSGYDCIATVELIQRRLDIQRFNNKCSNDGGYICGDMKDDTIKKKIIDVIGNTEIDVLIATPPCQGMSIANRQKGDELERNSLVVESIKMIKTIKPKIFVLENVPAFLTSICTDIDGVDKTIQSTLELNLTDYNKAYNVINFLDYGANSSRKRTLVIGVRNDIDIYPYDLMPNKQKPKTLRDVIGHLKPLEMMGMIDRDDIYHNYKSFPKEKLRWIENLKEGESALFNKEDDRRPHKIVDGEKVFYKTSFQSKYRRQVWDDVAKCITTRNDILSSQNTIHPHDNRVFSIRECMLLMNIPIDFKWSDKSLEELNSMADDDKMSFLKKNEMNIRQCIGEGVPTIIFKQIADKIKERL